MHPRVDRRPADTPQPQAPQSQAPQPQAVLRPAALLLPLLAAACGELPRDVQPSYWWRNISGAYLDERQPPPGMNAPYPNLATVPPRPVPPDAATRAALTAALAGDREFARTEPEARPPGERAAPAALPEGAAPPPPPRLAAAPAIRFEPASPPAAPAAARPAPADPARPVPPAALPGPPALPLPELLGLPPAPTQDLLAPRAP
ncbi:hypothetical protein [Falsiroseomonas ponticola]|uniref:hypothetical protein n=1 Tax=Falsiroseomonas ponticola TaxID=2786951 RepID=UPI0019315E0E|nr:hypothetical protein [Roseomonas ponticola]